MIRFEINPIAMLDGESWEVTTAKDSQAWAVYYRGSSRLAQHLEDFPNYEEAFLFYEDKVNQWQADLIEQTALFGCDLDMNKIGQKVRDELQGCAGIYHFIAQEAERFHIDHYENGLANDGAYWDSNDWYLCSDDWFSHHIRPVLYGEGE